MLENESFINIILGYAVMIYAFMFKEGLFRGKLNTRFRKVVNLERLFWGEILEGISEKADDICFRAVLVMSICTIVNGILGLIWHSFPNVSFIFVLISFPGVMIFRFAYIYLKKGKNNETRQ